MGALVAALAAAPGPGLAQDEGPSRSRSRPVQTTSEAVGRRLQDVSALVQAGKYVDARAKLDALADRRGLNPYEQALIWQLYGFVDYGEGKLDAAVAAFEKSLAFDSLPLAAQRDLQFALGQLFLVTGRTDRAIALLEDWIAQVEAPSAQALYLLGSAHAQQEDWKQALGYAERAVSGVERPKPSWLQLLLVSQVELEQKTQAVRTLKRLIGARSKKSDWIQLAALYEELDQGEKALATLELADRLHGLDRPSELLHWAQLYRAHELPRKAARVLDRGLEKGILPADAANLQRLGDAWMSAREFERAIEPLRRAAELSESGDAFLRLGQVYAEREEWSLARQNLEKALARGGLTDPAQAELLMGVASFHDQRLSAARRAFERAGQYDATREQARNWLTYLSRRDS